MDFCSSEIADMKNFLEKIFPVIRDEKIKIYMAFCLLIIFLLLYEKDNIESAILMTLAPILPLAMLQGVRDDYLRFSQSEDPESGRKTPQEFIIWAIRHTNEGFKAALFSIVYIVTLAICILQKFTDLI